jgi:hypothetical protein
MVGLVDNRAPVESMTGSKITGCSSIPDKGRLLCIGIRAYLLLLAARYAFEANQPQGNEQLLRGIQGAGCKHDVTVRGIKL